MKCAWQAFINLLPVWMRDEVDKHGKDTLQELRLRMNQPPQLIRANGTMLLTRITSIEDLSFCVNVASRYSPWSVATVAGGYITAQGGHRIGICGDAVSEGGVMTNIRTPTSLCIRVSRDFPGIASNALCYKNSVLIIGRPGSGKTTLLRDLIRQRSDHLGETIGVVDEREEIFPYANKHSCFPVGKNTDILRGCSKEQGVEIMLRNMSPDTIAVDEITAEKDCRALLHAGWCGVKLLATAHAGSRMDLEQRPIYRPILDSALFDTLLIIHRDKSWHIERMSGICQN